MLLADEHLLLGRRQRRPPLHGFALRRALALGRAAAAAARVPTRSDLGAAQSLVIARPARHRLHLERLAALLVRSRTARCWPCSRCRERPRAARPRLRPARDGRADRAGGARGSVRPPAAPSARSRSRICTRPHWRRSRSSGFACAEAARRWPDRSLLARAAHPAAHRGASRAPRCSRCPGCCRRCARALGFVGKEDPWAAQQRRAAAALLAGAAPGPPAPALVLRRLRLLDSAGAARGARRSRAIRGAAIRRWCSRSGRRASARSRSASSATAATTRRPEPSDSRSASTRCDAVCRTPARTRRRDARRTASAPDRSSRSTSARRDWSSRAQRDGPARRSAARHRDAARSIDSPRRSAA